MDYNVTAIQKQFIDFYDIRNIHKRQNLKGSYIATLDNYHGAVIL